MYLLIGIVVLLYLLFTFKDNFTNIREKFASMKENISWEKAVGATECKKIHIDGNYIYKLYGNKAIVSKIKNFYDSHLKSLSFVPRMEFDIYNKIVKETYYKTHLTKQNRPADYIEQLRNIDKILKRKKIFHNDFNSKHFFLDGNKIKVIDWGAVTLDKPISKTNTKRTWVSNDIDREINRLS